MFDTVLEIVKKAGIFLVVAQSLLHLCVADSFEKYIKLLVGIITVLMLVFPILTVFRNESFENFEQYRMSYEEKFLEEKIDFEQIRDENFHQSLYVGDKQSND